MKKYKVYRTEKGNLTFKETAEYAYTIMSSTELGAEDALRMLKQADKRLKKEDE